MELRLIHVDLLSKIGYPNTCLAWARFVKEKDPEATFEKVNAFVADRWDSEYHFNRGINIYDKIHTAPALLVKPSKKHTLFTQTPTNGASIIYRDFLEVRRPGADPRKSFSLAQGYIFQPKDLGISKEQYLAILRKQEENEIDSYLK